MNLIQIYSVTTGELPVQLAQALQARTAGVPQHVADTVRAIVADVRARGDEALFAYTQRFDGVTLSADTVRVTPAQIEQAMRSADERLLQAMRLAARNITAYHQKQLQNAWLISEPGRQLGQLLLPLASAAVYVPGGRAAYPSSVLMNVIPARVAGVERIVMVTPPERDGSVSVGTLCAAAIAGVDEIYTIGGAQAIAALAYGTRTIPAVDKITGPGNIYVAAAKREVFGQVGIDMIAGPSEVLIVADGSADPAAVAADLLAQAEHDPMAAAMLVCTDAALAQAVAQALKEQLTTLPRADIATASLRDYGFIAVVPTLADAMALANRVAPEHLELCVREPMGLLGAVRHAGAVFMGHYSPESLGDYLAGTNHVLPTGGTARFSSPLGVDDFMKKTAFVYYTRDALAQVSADIDIFAQAEGLHAHARAATIRFDQED